MKSVTSYQLYIRTERERETNLHFRNINPLEYCTFLTKKSIADLKQRSKKYTQKQIQLNKKDPSEVRSKLIEK